MLPELDVDNVYVYIADDVRQDFAPVEVLNRGLRFKTIASGIHSPTSISSLLSGTFLPQHRVGRFQDTLPGDVPSLLRRDDAETCFTNTLAARVDMDPEDDIISATLDTEGESIDRFGEIDPPFVFVERAIGGHSPYDRRDDRGPEADGSNFYGNLVDDPPHRYAQRYQAGVDDDTSQFRSRLEWLDERGLREDTLVVYVSDHGELLGENGMIAHAPPIHPAHVYVPTVFIHPDLPAGEEADGVFRHVDLVPTLSSLFDWGWDTPIQPVGRDLTTQDTAEYGCTYYMAQHSTPVGQRAFRFESVWDRHGGYVFPRMDTFERGMLAAYHLLEAPWAAYPRRNPLEHLVFKLRGTRRHGAPAFSPEHAERILARVAEHGESGDTTGGENKIPTERLEQLGYIE